MEKQERNELLAELGLTKDEAKKMWKELLDADHKKCCELAYEGYGFKDLEEKHLRKLPKWYEKTFEKQEPKVKKVENQVNLEELSDSELKELAEKQLLTIGTITDDIAKRLIQSKFEMNRIVSEIAEDSSKIMISELSLLDTVICIEWMANPIASGRYSFGGFVGEPYLADGVKEEKTNENLLSRINANTLTKNDMFYLLTEKQTDVVTDSNNKMVAVIVELGDNYYSVNLHKDGLPEEIIPVEAKEVTNIIYVPIEKEAILEETKVPEEAEEVEEVAEVEKEMDSEEDEIEMD